MSDFGRELKRLMAERGIGVRQLARAVYCNPGHVSNLRNGNTRPSPELAAALDKHLGGGGKLVTLAARRPSAVMLGAVLDGAAAEAMEFTRLAAVSGVGRGVLDHLDAVIHGLDRAYSRESPAELFALARAYRVRVADLTSGPCTLREKRELYVRGAWLSELLAWIAHDLGHVIAAEAYAIDAFEHADQAGHAELCGWAADAMSSIALYTGRPGRAADAARRGIARGPDRHPLSVRLRAQAARAAAKLGQPDQCEQMLAEAQSASDTLPTRSPLRPGTETGSLAEYAMTAYPASCYVWLGDYAKARAYGEQAIAVHESVPAVNRSPTREAIARIDLAIALAGLGVPDGAAALGRQALASPRVVESVLTRAADLDALLTARYADQEDARSFREEYRSMRTGREA